MKRIALLSTLASLAFISAQAQDAPPPKITSKPAKVREVETPIFGANNVGDRSWRPKKWLEMDAEFEVKLPAAAGGRKGSLSSMVVNFYVGFNHQSKAGKYEYAKGSFTVENVPSNEKCHLLGFLPPAVLHRVLEKENFNSSSDVKAWGFEVMVDSKRLAAESSTGGPWWDKSDGLELIDGSLLAKRDTPFSVLWGDYDVPTKKQ